MLLYQLLVHLGRLKWTITHQIQKFTSGYENLGNTLAKLGARTSNPIPSPGSWNGSCNVDEVRDLDSPGVEAGGPMYDRRSRAIASERPQSLTRLAGGGGTICTPFSRMSWVRRDWGGVENAITGSSRTIAGNSMLPTKALTSNLSQAEFLGARRLA